MTANTAVHPSPCSSRSDGEDQLNIADHFLDARVREGSGERRALITSQGEFSYARVQREAGRWASALAAAGLQREQRLMLALPDGLDFVAAFFGGLKLGAVVVMANPGLGADALGDLIEHTRAQVWVCSPEHELETSAATRINAPLAADPPDSDASAWTANSVATHRDESAIWLFSGGTTGRPKVVMQSHAAFVNTTQLYAHNVLELSADDITISVPRLFFGYATGSNLLFPFSVGACAILDDQRCTAPRLFELIARHRATMLINVPTMVGKMLAHAREHGVDTSSLRLATSAGEALPESLHAEWNERFGVELLDGLGTAEMWHIFISQRPGQIRPGCLGKVVPGFEIRVCDDEGCELPDNSIGWLEVRGGSRALGYWLAREHSEAAFRGYWYRSGDMVARDGQGWVTYAGRGDDMVKVSGQWLSPREVESCLVEHAQVREAVVVSAPDAQGLEKPYAFIVAVAEDGPGIDVDALRAFVRDRLQPYKAPKMIYTLTRFPKTHLGKADRAALRALVGTTDHPRN